jgi:hypothetical protein
MKRARAITFVISRIWEISDPLSELENHARIRNDSKRNHFLAAWTVSEKRRQVEPGSARGFKLSSDATIPSNFGSPAPRWFAGLSLNSMGVKRR